MIILAFYFPIGSQASWIERANEHLKKMRLEEGGILPLLLPSSEVKTGSIKVECVYPRFAFEYEEKETNQIREIVEKLEERIRMLDEVDKMSTKG